ncbi:MAG: hemerythrin domain-containing protein [Burkholderiales bacterium]
MKNPLEAWHIDHAYFYRLLALLQKEVDGFHFGAQPNYELMLDIIGYLRDYSDQIHHPAEDVAFARLARHCPDMELSLSRLNQEHRVIAQAGETLRQYLNAVQNDVIVPKAQIEIAAATYLVYYIHHIAKEEEDVLPRAAKFLTPADWEAVASAAPQGRDPLFGGAEEERYKVLRRRIALES